MTADFVNIGLGFLEGLALIVSPCILPILPIILAGSLSGSKKRPIGIIIGFVVIFALFTFFSRKLVQYSGIDLNLIRHISYGILLLLGVMMLSTYLTESFNQLTQRLINTGSGFSSANNPQGGFISGVLFGSLIAIIWTPCAGPILAAIIVQIVIQKTNLLSFLTILAFGMGAAVPMFLIALFGREIMMKLTIIKTHTKLFRKLLGAIIIASVCYMVYSEGGVSVALASGAQTASTNALEDGLSNPYPAPALRGIVAWINSPPLQMSELKGKVVLIDFWTYSCINCIRTLPYVKDWYNKYHKDGLVVIGVHTPEFEFEKNLDNVKNAVAKDGILYPVALDSQFETWQNYNNQYWPAQYLIDKNGNVVYDHFGEGNDDVTENNIRFLLGLNGSAPTSVQPEAVSASMTPETYVGYARADRNTSPEAVAQNKSSIYSYPKQLSEDAWALQGAWTVMPDKIVSAAADAGLKIHFRARKVYMVLGNATHAPIKVKFLLDGEALIAHKGKDIVESELEVKNHALYEVVAMNQTASGILQVIASAPGLEVYTFTFG